MKTPHIAGKEPIISEMNPGEYYWCACGLSKKQPFCDGSHIDSGYGPVKLILTKKKKIAWCVCKHTKKPPFCDATHITLHPYKKIK